MAVTPNTVGQPNQAPIAIVGMACRLPGHCNTPRELWHFINQGKVAGIQPPSSRFDLKGHFDGSMKPNTMKTPGAMFMEDVDPEAFDAQFFNINHVEACSMDPQQRILLEISFECLENAGITRDNIEGSRLGCIVGASSVDYHDINCRDPEDRTESPTLGSCRALLSNRITHFLGAHGPSITIDTACSSALTALQMACLYLRTHEADAMLVCGVNMYLSPERNQDMGTMRETASATGFCHSFDAKADGYVIAEAANVVLIKRVSDAVRDGDPIRAILRGVAVNSAGRTSGISMPNPLAQAAVIRGAYDNAGIDESDMSLTGYIECHGTGTRVGDPAEARGLASVFTRSSSPASGRSLAIGSIKSNIGHSEAASGLSSLIKVVLSLENGFIPGTATFESPNPSIDFQTLGLKVFRDTIPWPAHSRMRAGINSFGFGGSNAHAVLESTESFLGNYPVRHKSSYIQDGEIQDDFFLEDNYNVAADSTPQLLLISANDKASLEAYAQSLCAHLLNPSVNVRMSDLAFTLSEHRSKLHHRAFAIARSAQISKSSFTFVQRLEESPVPAFVFTGQGAQWPAMGKSLLENSPVARQTVKDLDTALGELEEPPSFKLFDELVKDQDPTIVRRPELAQPLVTALQLAYVSVLSSCNIIPKFVVGHSSGEIAAAATVGHISFGDAIKIAYLRGQSVRALQGGQSLAMMAVGLSGDAIGHYVDPNDDLVQVACFNSPSNVTISGTLRALKNMQARLGKDQHFARLLNVDVAYHSEYMQSSADLYDQLLDINATSMFRKTNQEKSATSMISTVYGTHMSNAPAIGYWKENLMSPVRFDQAVRCLVDGEGAANILVEIGPSNTLASPITQVLRDVFHEEVGVKYLSVARRNGDSMTMVYRTVGEIACLGCSVNIAALNNYQTPSRLVDIPNYAWNHSIPHWNESLSSKEWRYRTFVRHDLLGTKVPGTTWLCPTWKNKIQIKDLPWLSDHKLGGQIVFPAAAYICMAVEAIYQATQMTTGKESSRESWTFRMRNAEFSKALVIHPIRHTTILLSLAPASRSLDSWSEFRISSVESDAVQLHASGLVRLDGGRSQVKAPAEMISPMKYPTSTQDWYQSFLAVGLQFGPLFQTHVAIEYVVGENTNRSMVRLEPPTSAWQQSQYDIHPASLDGCLQAASSTLWRGDRCNVVNAVVPRGIDALTLPLSSVQPSEAYVFAQAEYTGTGRPELPKNQTTSCRVYHPTDGGLLLDISGLRLVELESSIPSTSPHVYTSLSWDVDIETLSDTALRQVETQARADCNDVDSCDTTEVMVQKLIHMAGHKKPQLTVMELCLETAKTTSLVRDMLVSPDRDAASRIGQYTYVAQDPSKVAAMEKEYDGVENANFMIYDFGQAALAMGQKIDVAIVRQSTQHSSDLRQPIGKIASCLTDGGMVLVVNGQREDIGLHAATQVPRLSMLAQIKTISLYQMGISPPDDPPYGTKLVRLIERATYGVEHDFTRLGWDITLSNPREVNSRQKIIILDELEATVVKSIECQGWEWLKKLIAVECDILWVTRQAQMQVTCPDRSLAHGLLRTIRNESPRLNIITLDVEHSTGDATLHAIKKCLALLHGADATLQKDSEFVERGGMMYVGRVLPDNILGKAVSGTMTEAGRDIVLFQDPNKHIRLKAERVGSVDSLHYYEVHDESSILREGCVKIQIVAAGVNFKDVAKTLGLVPGDEHCLGEDGSGIVTSVAPDVIDIKPGDRVAFFKTGSFANVICASAKRVQHIPEWMSFEEAATIPCAFITALHCLKGLAGVTAGDKVLIHSAAGGVGMAAIQICHYIGATVFATVGSAEKKSFLISRFGLPEDRIFSSRTTEFAEQILNYTGGSGVDVILNSLAGELLSASWGIVAEGGTMVEIGKKDVLERAVLSMEPFNRNASFRAFDLSLLMNDDKLAVLLNEIFRLLSLGFLQPITPVHPFSFTEVPAALRHIGSGKHMGKAVVVNSADQPQGLTVRPLPRGMGLEGNSSYLIVGGLRGVCGSLALHLALNGAKSLTVLSRSSQSDQRSEKMKIDIEACGCSVKSVQGDVTVIGDVRRAFDQSAFPVRGIIQGAMVLKDRTFEGMTIEDFHAALRCKVEGTWNLHEVSLEQEHRLDFFTMLSSVSGITGRKGQANYAAGNTFLDAFATYRKTLGLKACSVALGAIGHIGYLAENQSIREGFRDDVWFTIGEAVLREIFSLSTQQQQTIPVSRTSLANMITGIRAPQPRDSMLLKDPRFSHLNVPDRSAFKPDAPAEKSDEVRTLLIALRSKSEIKALLQLSISVCNNYLSKSLQMSTPLDPSRPFSVYGIDSFVAIEFRNFLRTELGVEMTTLEILSASSLTAVCRQVLERIRHE
ncbi:reducing type I polyketide synthase [Xylariaceae sp. FL1019]|nr:reducing type I polyketide synthase [Xylariaceae sp. FL1019]